MKKLQSIIAAAVLAALALGLGIEQTVVAQRVGAPGLTVGSPSPLLDGRTPVFIEHGADPTVSPGFDAPPGSIIKFGTAYYLRRGVNTGNATSAMPTSRTDWELIAPSRLATWDTTKTRYYLLDYDGGSDSASCFVDATPGATITPGANACKTPEHLLQIFPRFGNGRSVVILLKPRAAGATYKNIAGTTDAILDFGSVSGYAYFLVRGSTDLTNSATDRVRVGAQTQAAGPNGDGSWTCAAGATTTTLTVSAGSLPTDLNASGYRVRYSTGALAGATRPIHSSLAGTLTFATVSTACSNGDQFFIESPGVAVGNIRLGTLTAPDTSLAVVGVATTAAAGGLTLGSSAGSYVFSFINVTGANTNNLQTNTGGGSGSISISPQYTDEAGSVRIVGGSRFMGSVQVRWFSGPLFVDAAFFGLQTGRAFDYNSPGQLWFGVNGSVTVAGGLLLTSCGSESGKDNTFVPPVVLGRHVNGALPRTRLLGLGTQSFSSTLTSVGCGAVVAGVDITAGGVYGIRSVTAGSTWFVSDTTASGSTASFALSSAFDTRLIVNTANTTFSGTAGAIELVGPAYQAVADVALTNVIDEAHNHVLSASAIVKVAQATRVTNKSGGALAVGNIVKSNGTTAQVTCAKADTSAASAAVLGVMVTAPANNAEGYMVAVGVPYVLYDGAPTVGAITYLSPGTACKATTTVPAVAGTNQKIRIGRNLTASASTGYAAFAPDWLAVAADGNP